MPLAAALLSPFLTVACTSQGPALVLDPVGPAPLLARAGAMMGQLVVYSAYDTHASASPTRSLDEDYYSDYEIRSMDGKLRQKVSNCANPLISVAPATVELPPGQYQVVAATNGFGLVTIPVVILRDRVTTLHLEGGSAWGTKNAFTQANAVRLPDGRVVGWRASAGAN